MILSALRWLRCALFCDRVEFTGKKSLAGVIYQVRCACGTLYAVSTDQRHYGNMLQWDASFEEICAPAHNGDGAKP